MLEGDVLAYTAIGSDAAADTITEGGPRDG